MNSEGRFSFNPEVHRLLHSRKGGFGQNWVIVKRKVGFFCSEPGKGKNVKGAIR